MNLFNCGGNKKEHRGGEVDWHSAQPEDNPNANDRK